MCGNHIPEMLMIIGFQDLLDLYRLWAHWSITRCWKEKRSLPGRRTGFWWNCGELTIDLWGFPWRFSWWVHQAQWGSKPANQTGDSTHSIHGQILRVFKKSLAAISESDARCGRECQLLVAPQWLHPRCALSKLSNFGAKVHWRIWPFWARCRNLLQALLSSFANGLPTSEIWWVKLCQK